VHLVAHQRLVADENSRRSQPLAHRHAGPFAQLLTQRRLLPHVKSAHDELRIFPLEVIEGQLNPVALLAAGLVKVGQVDRGPLNRDLRCRRGRELYRGQRHAALGQVEVNQLAQTGLDLVIAQERVLADEDLRDVAVLQAILLLQGRHELVAALLQIVLMNHHLTFLVSVEDWRQDLLHQGQAVPAVAIPEEPEMHPPIRHRSWCAGRRHILITHVADIDRGRGAGNGDGGGREQARDRRVIHTPGRQVALDQPRQLVGNLA